MSNHGRINKLRKLLGIVGSIIVLLLVIALVIITIASIMPILVMENMLIATYRVIQSLVVVSIIVALVLLKTLVDEMRDLAAQSQQPCVADKQKFEKMWKRIALILLIIALCFSNILYPIQTNYSIAITITIVQIVFAAILMIYLYQFKDIIQTYVVCLGT